MLYISKLDRQSSKLPNKKVELRDFFHSWLVEKFGAKIKNPFSIIWHIISFTNRANNYL